MWTPKWFDVLFALLTSPATLVAIGIVLALLASLLVRAAWRAFSPAKKKGGA